MPLILKKHEHPNPTLMLSRELWTNMQQTCREKEGVELLMMVEKVTQGQRGAITKAIVLKHGRPEFIDIMSLPEVSFFIASGLSVTLSSTPSGIGIHTLNKIWPEAKDDYQQFWHMPDGVVVLPDNPFWLEGKMAEARDDKDVHIGGLFCRPCEGTHHERMMRDKNIEQMRVYTEQMFQTPKHTDSQIVLT